MTGWAYTIIPLHLGTQEVDKSTLTLRHGAGTKIKAPFLAYLITGGPSPVLVDSGPGDDDEFSARHHNPLVRNESQQLVAALRRHGVSPDDVHLVINTHLHWDHCSGNHHLAKARFLVQRSELRYAAAPLPSDAPIYETNLGTAPYLRWHDRIDVVEGDADVFSGIRVFALPGHTPGFQGVIVRGASRDIVIASDHAPLFENWNDTCPPGIYVDLEAWYRSQRRLENLNDPVVLPGHDMRVLECERYP